MQLARTVKPIYPIRWSLDDELSEWESYDSELRIAQNVEFQAGDDDDYDAIDDEGSWVRVIVWSLEVLLVHKVDTKFAVSDLTIGQLPGTDVTVEVIGAKYVSRGLNRLNESIGEHELRRLTLAHSQTRQLEPSPLSTDDFDSLWMSSRMNGVYP